MEVSVVTAMRVPHRGDLLAARYALAASDQHGVEVAVKGVDVFHAPAFAIGVPHDDNVAPPQVDVAGKYNDAVTDAVNGVPKVGIPAPNSIPVFPKMSVRTKAAGFVVTFRLWFSDWKIEAVGDLGKTGIQRAADGGDHFRRIF